MKDELVKILTDCLTEVYGRDVPDDCEECHWNEPDEIEGADCDYARGEGRPSICKDMVVCAHDYDHSGIIAGKVVNLVQPIIDAAVKEAVEKERERIELNSYDVPLAPGLLIFSRNRLNEGN